MAVYFANTEITGIKDLFPLSSKDITGLYFADTELFTVWGEYDGTLPAQYSANGSMLADYRVYGSAGGVGDKTENIFDISKVQNSYVTVDGDTFYKTTTGYFYDLNCFTTGSSANGDTDKMIPVKAGTYTISCTSSSPSSISCAIRYFNGESQSYAHSTGVIPYDFTVPTDGKISVRLSESSQVTIKGLKICPGSTAPAEYVPYGYKLDISVSDGTTSTTTQIYIGSDPLGEDEYVDYGEQKVYRRTENLWNVDFVRGSYRSNDGVFQYSENYITNTTKVAVESETAYTIDFKSAFSGAINREYAFFWDSQNQYSGAVALVNHSFSTPDSAAYCVVSIGSTASGLLPSDISEFMLIEGSTVPSTYIPYLQPTDPPVPLPALPTVDGTNIVDYAGQSAAVPSRFMAKYRKEGFK